MNGVHRGRYDWVRIGGWSAALAFCVAVWVALVVAVVAIVRGVS